MSASLDQVFNTQSKPNLATEKCLNACTYP